MESGQNQRQFQFVVRAAASVDILPFLHRYPAQGYAGIGVTFRIIWQTSVNII